MFWAVAMNGEPMLLNLFDLARTIEACSAQQKWLPVYLRVGRGWIFNEEPTSAYGALYIWRGPWNTVQLFFDTCLAQVEHWQLWSGDLLLCHFFSIYQLANGCQQLGLLRPHFVGIFLGWNSSRQEWRTLPSPTRRSWEVTVLVRKVLLAVVCAVYPSSFSGSTVTEKTALFCQ